FVGADAAAGAGCVGDGFCGAAVGVVASGGLQAASSSAYPTAIHGARRTLSMCHPLPYSASDPGDLNDGAHSRGRHTS
ncbi:MAG TPA: hypothetical protein VHX16_13610, partial [Chloroflexota bacterium]|nr:hypothetical protein [Chloroflexota bacterium]